MKKEFNIENTHNKDEISLNIDSICVNGQKAKLIKERESSSSQNKMESEIANSLPLSFDIPYKDFSHVIKDTPTENSAKNQLPIAYNQTINSYNTHANNMAGFDKSSSPFVVDVHRLSFNNIEFNFPPSRSLFLNSNNFESPYVMKTNHSQLSSSPLTIKISNSMKNINDYEKDAVNSDFNCNSFFMGNQSNGTIFNSHMNSNFNPPNVFNGDLNFYNAINKNQRKKQNNKIKETCNILKYLDDETQKELLEKDQFKIKLCKNEKLIKSIFERKEESLTSSEENSRKIFGMRINSKLSHADSENIYVGEDHASNQNTNYNFHSRYRIDPSKLLNNITYTLNNVNTDFNHGYRKNYSSQEFHDYSNRNNFLVNKPTIPINFLKEDKEKEKRSNPENLTKEGIQDNKSTKNLGENSTKVCCNCKKSKCLKLYCDCFAIQGYCEDCNCVDCHNTINYESEREKVILSIKEKNPAAFKPKIGLINNNLLKHTKGCNCTKSNCQKKYCECFQTGIDCSDLCRCRDCHNLGANKCKPHTLSMIDNFGLNNNESIENISFAEKIRKDSRSTCNYQIESESICLNSKPAIQVINIKKNNSSGSSFNANNNVYNVKALHDNFSFMSNTKNKKSNNKSCSPIKNRMTERKRKRKNQKARKSAERIKGHIKKDRDIMLMINNLNNIHKGGIVPKILPVPSHPVQPIATPRKNSKLLPENTSNKFDPNIFSANSKNINRTYEKKYRDTTLTHIVTTAPNTSKKRNSTIFNTKDFDRNIIKKLNMNVNNEPLFDLKNKK